MQNNFGEMYRAGLPTLGARLLITANAVRQGKVAADIGCDHGKLAVYLAKTGRCTKVIAADINALPLARATALAKQTNTQHLVDCRLGNGLQILRPLEADDIIVAGVSGETIIDILAVAGWIRHKDIHLILVPPTHPERLRRWLYANGFYLQAETAVEENGRVYSVMSVFYSGDKITDLPEFFYRLGLLPQNKTKAAIIYMQKLLSHLRRKIHQRLPEVEKQKLELLIKQVQKEIDCG